MCYHTLMKRTIDTQREGKTTNTSDPQPMNKDAGRSSLTKAAKVLALIQIFIIVLAVVTFYVTVADFVGSSSRLANPLYSPIYRVGPWLILLVALANVVVQIAYFLRGNVTRFIGLSISSLILSGCVLFLLGKSLLQ